MQLPVFEHAYLLQSLGWAIINSLWQSACLWALYKLITGVDKRLTAQVKYNLGLLLMTTTFAWFLFTFLQNYRLLTNASPFAESFLPQKWILDTVIFTSSLPFLSIAYVVFLAFHTQQFIKNLFA